MPDEVLNARAVPSEAPREQSTGDRVITEDQLRARRQDWVRASITGCFLLILLIVVVFSCWEASSWPDHWIRTKELLEVMLPALTGLLGSSLGFYFGSKTPESHP